MRPRFVRVDNAAEQLCCSRSKFYELVSAGLIEIRHSFGSTLVSQESVDKYLDSLPPAKPRAAPYALARRAGRQKGARPALAAAE